MRPSVPAPARAAALAALAVAGAYQLPPRPLELQPGRSALAHVLFQDFHGGEEGYRWTRARSRIVFPEPGSGVRVRVEADVQGWRPRGSPPPAVALALGQARLGAHAGNRPETLTLATTTGGSWSSDLELEISSETFVPGAGDTRELGLRVSAVRLVPADDGWRPRWPPLRPLVMTALAGALLRLLVPRRRGVGVAVALMAAGGFALARPWAALALPWLDAVLAAAGACALGAPRLWATATGRLRDTGASLLTGARTVLRPAGLGALTVGGLALAAADRTRPPITWELGSGRAEVVATDLGPYDAAGGVRFRTVSRRARFDLGDFGSGAFDVSVRASAPEVRPPASVGDVSGARLVLAPAPDWRWTDVRIERGWGWSPGPTLAFGVEAERGGLRLSHVRLERRGGWVAGRVLAAALGTAALAGLAAGSAGLGAVACALCALVTLVGLALAVRADAGVVLPFVVPLAGIAALGALLAALLSTLAARSAGRAATGAGAHGGDARAAALAPGVRAVVALGFAGWLAAVSFPLYRGGHFVFHSAIAEEIWKGRFLVYYLPYPGSMLSHQAQWGSVLVPHPCLYQTLVSPLAALPRPAFYAAEKAVLALLFCGLALAAARLAAHAGGARAATAAALLVAGAVPGYQLLGLGHLMTILGCFAGTLALGFLALRAERLDERGTWAALVALAAFAFLSYTAALLFVSIVLAALAAWWWRTERRQARGVAGAALLAATVAFALYYVNWAWPFLSESVPRLLAGGGQPAAHDDADRLGRLLAQPGKLDYSYGSWLVPLLGLAGLGLARQSALRTVLVAWAALLPLFGGLDLFFNFLLKHHYFVLAPVAVGGGLLLARLEAHGALGRALAAVLLLAFLGLGLDTALAVATGRIP